MKPWIEITDNVIIVDTQHMTITVHVKNEQTNLPVEHSPGVAISYHRTATLEHTVEEKQPQAASTGKLSRAKTGMKQCTICGATYKASSNGQRYCTRCKENGIKCKEAKPRKNKRLSEMEDKELDKTLEEIERNRKKTYEIPR